jgi:superfamily I DNA/RNA helicase
VPSNETECISIEESLEVVRTTLSRHLNEPQSECIEHSLNPALMIIAGPSLGETTVLVLRTLRHLRVDGMVAESILMTTFTR